MTWEEFVKLKATDAELKRFATSHKDLVGGTQIKVRHIFLKVPPGASAVEKAQAKVKDFRAWNPNCQA